MPDNQTRRAAVLAQITAAVEWLQADSAAVALVLDLSDDAGDRFVAVARDGRWHVASTEGAAQAMADAFGGGF